MHATIDIYLETGKKRTFAGAIRWPGWCRSGRDDAAAMQALIDAAPRYARIAHVAGLPFDAPRDPGQLAIVERLAGNATTDFGAPDAVPAADTQPFDTAALVRSLAVLEAIWRSFDAGVSDAVGKPLRKGPRGGGRDLDGIVEHVLGAETAYLARLAWKLDRSRYASSREVLEHTRQAIRAALAAAAKGELPTRGPRGGSVWLPRYFVRRAAWHILDHLWEIEDRAA